jgi:hypothetical protein
MGILRTDVLSHSQLSNGNASVLFDGTTDSITIPSHSAFAFGTADYTVEMFVNFTALSGQQTLVGDTYGATNGFYFYKRSDHKLGWYYDDSNYWNANTLIETDRWYHLAFVRHGGTARIYIDGVLDGEDPTDTFDATVTQYYIADTADQTSGEFFGYMSNLRITRTAVYKTNFTVPKFKLKEIPGTILLALQSSSSTTEAAVSVAGTLTANGDPAVSAFGPGLKDDITDTGVVFDGVTTFDSQAYFVPPGGNTRERNRGRGVLGGGAPYVSPSVINNMSYHEVQSQGIFQDFGDLTLARGNMVAGQNSSSTRGLSSGGWTNPAGVNTIDFITIANTANAIDFGDTTITRPNGGLSNQTRSLTASSGDLINTIDFVTIATTGNASDFGDLLDARGLVSGVSSPTRGVFGGGRNNTPSSNTEYNTLQFITIASTGNAQDFGDLTRTRYGMSGFSSATRGIFAGGYSNPQGKWEGIEFFTIATLGNATDFGDLSASQGYGGSLTNTILGLITINNPSNYYNTIEFITISTTGNALDFGDADPLGSGKGHGSFPSCMSDSHGGTT